MKISKRQLRQIIKEELSIALKEMDGDPSAWIGEKPDLPKLTVDQQEDFNDCVARKRGDFRLGEQGTKELYQHCLDEVTSELSEGFGDMFGLGKKLSPDVRNAVDKIKSVNPHDDDPAITQTGRGKWNKQRTSHIKKLKKGELSPEEAKRLYGVK